MSPTQIRRTETIENTSNPDFVKRFTMDYYFEKKQHLKFDLWGHISNYFQFSYCLQFDLYGKRFDSDLNKNISACEVNMYIA